MSQKDSKPFEEPKTAPRGSSSSQENQGGNFADVVASALRNAQRGTAIASLTDEHTAKNMEILIEPGNDFAFGPISRTLKVGDREKIEIGQQRTTDRGDSANAENDGFLKDLKKKLSSKGNCYKLENDSCALVINNVFNGPAQGQGYHEWFRKGAEGDTEKVSLLFKDFFKFAFVQKEENVPLARLAKILEDFRNTAKVLRCSACFIMIMSHGGKMADSIVMDDLKEVDLYKDIVYKFSDHDDVRVLPKVFLVQACRDSREPPIVDDCRPLDAAGDIRDVLIGHSTIPHFTAGRDEQEGALYFGVIDQVFREKAKTSTLKAMLFDVFYQLLHEHGQKAQVQDIGFQDYRFKLP